MSNEIQLRGEEDLPGRPADRSGLTAASADDAALRFVLDAIGDGFILLDRDFTVTMLNAEALRIDGRNADEILGRSHWQVWPASAGTAVEAAYRRVMETRRPETLEHRYVFGVQDVWLDIRVYPAPDGIAVLYRDITSARRTEAELAETARRLTAVLDNATVAVFLMDEHQQCAYMNPAAERLTGYSFDETRGRALHDVIHHTRPDGSPYPLAECPIDRAFPENAREQGEEVFVHRDGHFYPVAFTASPIRDAEATVVGTIIEVRDVSEEKRSEAARQLLMREVDHRARNALAVVQSIMKLSRASDVTGYRDTVLGRVGALARAQTSLSQRRWDGAALRDLIRDEMAPLAQPDRISLEGPELAVDAQTAQPVSMLVHELATNAVKYGALSVADGRVKIAWRTTPEGLSLAWTESGGPAVAAPTATGFGVRMIRELARQAGGRVVWDWRPDGLHLALDLPRERLV